MSDMNHKEIKKETEGSYILLSNKDVKRSWINWLFNNQANYNYERMMGTGFLHAMVPIAKKLYKDDMEKQREMLRRHTGFFNCEPCIGSAIAGLTVAMEEQKAAGGEIEGEAVTSIKTGLMGPLSGIGDSIIQGVIVPLLLAFAIDMASGGSVVAPIVYSLVMIAVVFGISYTLFMTGYKKGSGAILNILENGIVNKIIAGANIMGCMVLGALVANYVSMSCGIQIQQTADSVFSVQEQLFDTIIPKLLPLLLTLGSYKMLKKGWSSVKVLLLIVIIGVIGGVTGILG
ncbi:PTS system IID component (Man family) [Kineothrix alysoides]|uniref:PTS system IID component (Man family) n=1 Tax=Kineothrix alysoides TaxID=1469948 RepID=A0A4R1R505_9FIRM|nr:PTS system mannose/fructose/sorbose family transporter subunit IID [Kineothrix alysoides]TCL60352.1 PTS system IID component (Man family) [Kineothrix alysoides]